MEVNNAGKDCSAARAGITMPVAVITFWIIYPPAALLTH